MDKPPNPPTFPARPMNGGKLENAEPLTGDWRYKPKWNGRRCLVHVPTMRTWNRQLEEVSYVFPAFKKLQDIIGTSDLIGPDKMFVEPLLEWVDVEFIYGRHSIGRASVIVLDFVSTLPWCRRQSILGEVFVEHRLGGLKLPDKNEAYFGVPIPQLLRETDAWEDMKLINQETKIEFYEGLVAYDINQPYPIQLFSPKRETRHWMKYRFVN